MTDTGAWSGLSLAFGVLFKLGLVIALAYGSLYLLRRWQGGALGVAHKQVVVLETTRLSPRQALHLVKAGNRAWLIGATDQALTVLAEVEARPEVEPQPVSTQPATVGADKCVRPYSFASALGRAFRKGEV